MCARSGSTVRLKADLHPTGGRGSVVTTADGTFKVGFGESSARSPLCVRSTEMVSGWALSAVPAPVIASARPAAARSKRAPL